MVNIDQAVIAKLKKGGENFEILVDSDKALELKQGKNVDLNDVLAEFKIFSDAKKGLLATESKFGELFGSENVEDIAREIIKKGEIQITAEHRKKLIEEKRNRIIGKITSNAIDAQTKLPIPRQRIELCFEQLKIKVNEHDTDEYQIDQILSKIKTLIPIKFETFIIEARINHQYSSKAMNYIKREYPNASQIWDEDGNVLVKFKIPAGRADELKAKLNSLTQGNVHIDIKEK